MSLLIKNGRIVTGDSDYIADIYCRDEQITAIGRDLGISSADEVIDATGKFVFPGFIDPHVHVYLPFMGTSAKDDYRSVSQAALVGGTTTLIEMCCPAATDCPVEAFNQWRSNAQHAAVDYSFHMGVTAFNDQTETKLKSIVDQGIRSFKIFLAYEGAFGIGDRELFRTLELANRLGVVVTAHCENAVLISQLQQRLLAAGKTGPQYHEPSRPEIVEVEGVKRLMTFAELTDCPVYVVHTSCQPAIDAIQAARQRGVRAWIETVIPFLVLDKSAAERPDFEGAKFVMSPPIRHQRNQPLLWNALSNHVIDTVATDHAPFDLAQKRMGQNDFTKIPNGIPSVEHRIQLLYTHGVHQGRIDLSRFVQVASTQAAKIFGLYPQKGTIQIGSDADLVVFDPDYRGVISAATHSMQVDYSAFEGWPIVGRSEWVTVRGAVQVRHGQFVGEFGRGQFLGQRIAQESW